MVCVLDKYLLLSEFPCFSLESIAEVFFFFPANMQILFHITDDFDDF